MAQQTFTLRPDPTLRGQTLPDPCQTLPAVSKAALEGLGGRQALSLPLANGQRQKYSYEIGNIFTAPRKFPALSISVFKRRVVARRDRSKAGDAGSQQRRLLLRVLPEVSLLSLASQVTSQLSHPPTRPRRPLSTSLSPGEPLPRSASVPWAPKSCGFAACGLAKGQRACLPLTRPRGIKVPISVRGGNGRANELMSK